MRSVQQKQALDQVLRLVDLLNKDMADSFATNGLSQARAHLLWALHHAGPSTGKALADQLRVTPRNITGLVDGLAADDLVVRQPHPTDRRASLITLTDKGSRLAAEMASGYQELAELMFGPLTDRQLGEFGSKLTAMVDRLDEAVNGHQAVTR